MLFYHVLFCLVVCQILGSVLGGLLLIGLVLLLIVCIKYPCFRKRKHHYHSFTLNKKKKKGLFVGMDDVEEPADSKEQQEDNAAMMNALFFLRGHPRYEMNHALQRVGSRRGKHFFLLNERQGNRIVENVAVLELIEQGPDCPVSISGETVTFEHMFQETWRAHPNISAPLVVEVIPATNVLAVVRPWHTRGSLRDFIHRCDPQQTFTHKYRSPAEPLALKNIAKFGRDVLEGMLFLKQLGVPCYHLHAGNVLVDPPHGCVLADFENNVLGVPPRHAEIIRTLAAKHVQPDVACFACILFEMASGSELTSIEAADVLLSPTSSCPNEVRSILTSILNTWATSPPDVEDLLRTDIFARVEIEKPIPKLTITMPEKVHRLFLDSAESLANSVIKNKSSSSSSAILVKGVRFHPSGKSKSHHHKSGSGSPELGTAAKSATATEKTSLLDEDDEVVV